MMYESKFSEFWISNDLFEQKEIESLCTQHSHVQITAHIIYRLKD